MAARVVVLGNINQDFVVRADRMPRPGETILGSDVKFVAGGKGANQAVTAARLQAETTLIGRVGQDAFGPILLENLRREGVESRYVGSDDDVATGMAFIALAPDGQNSILSVGGANLECAPRYIEDATPVIRHADVALVQFAVPLESVEMFVKIAADDGEDDFQHRVAIRKAAVRAPCRPEWQPAGGWSSRPGRRVAGGRR